MRSLELDVARGASGLDGKSQVGALCAYRLLADHATAGVGRARANSKPCQGSLKRFQNVKSRRL